MAAGGGGGGENKLSRMMLHRFGRRRCPYLPEEIVLHILLYASADDLARFKSVSKLWSSLISNDSFVDAHFLRSQSRTNILFTTVTDPTNVIPNYEYRHLSVTITQINTVSVNQLRLHYHKQIGTAQKVLDLKASCDGFLLLQDKYNHLQLYIGNPATSQFEPLPLPHEDNCIHWALVRDDSIHKYKVFGIHALISNHVLTVGDDRWTESVYRGKNGIEDVLSNVLLVQNELHFLTTDTVEDDNQILYFIFAIHIQTLESTRIKISSHLLPYTPRDPFNLSSVKGRHLLSEDVKGSLCLTFVSPTKLEMFVLQDRANCVWTKSNKLLLQSLSHCPPPRGGFLSADTCLFAMRGVDSTDLRDLLKLLIHTGDELFLYDFKTQKSTPIGFLSKDRKLSKSYCHHTGSLLTF